MMVVLIHEHMGPCSVGRRGRERDTAGREERDVCSSSMPVCRGGGVPRVAEEECAAAAMAPCRAAGAGPCRSTGSGFCQPAVTASERPQARPYSSPFSSSRSAHIPQSSPHHACRRQGFTCIVARGFLLFFFSRQSGSAIRILGPAAR
jgi:hypothetical protein